MKPTETLARDVLRDGTRVELTRRDGAYRLSLDGQELMSSRQHGSERELARLALAALPPSAARPRVLVGGLGFGYTLRAALDLLPASAAVVVAEVLPFLIAAHRLEPEAGGVGDLAQRPLDDPRVEVFAGDLLDLLADPQRGGYDALLLDVDNGPWAFTLPSNERLYGPKGLALCRARLAPRGVLAVWSAEPAPEFAARLERAGFRASTHRAAPREGARRRHVIFVAQRLD